MSLHNTKILLVCIAVVLVLLLIYMYREPMTNLEGEIALVKAGLQRQENILYQCTPNCHEHAVKLSVFDAEVKDAKARLDRAMENVAIIKMHMECQCTDETPADQCKCNLKCPCKLRHAANAVVETVKAAVPAVPATPAVPNGPGAPATPAVPATPAESFVDGWFGRRSDTTSVKYYDDQRANCVGSVCLDRVGSNKVNLDIQGLIRRLDNQTALIQTLKYELQDRNARITALRAEINRAVGMY